MTSKLFIVCLVLISTLAVAAPKISGPPKHLQIQVQKLVELLRDSYATGYPDATSFQTIAIGPEQKITLVVFTVEGFGGGNSHTQYLAAFNVEVTEQGKEHYSFIDVIPIGGKGWRGIEKLKAKARQDKQSGEIAFEFGASEVTADNAPNFPSKKVNVTVTMKGGRLFEKKGP